MKRPSLAGCIAALLVIMLEVAAAADVIRLFEGTLLSGKIRSENETGFVFANARGTFRIKKTRVEDVYRTASYREDIAILRRLGGKFVESEVERHYRAGTGEERKEAAKDETKRPAADAEKEKTDAGDAWRTGRLSWSAGLLLVNRSGGTDQRSWSGHVAYDQGLDFIGEGRHPLLPGLRFEGGFTRYLTPGRLVEEFTAAGGPMWAFPSMKNGWGSFILAFMPGVSFYERGIYYFCGQAVFGYQISFGAFSLFVQTRYQYTAIRGNDLHGVSGEIGMGFNLW